MDSNHRMSESKSDALPTWRTGYNRFSFFCATTTPTPLTRQCPGFEPGPSFSQKDYNKIAEKNLNGQK